MGEKDRAPDTYLQLKLQPAGGQRKGLHHLSLSCAYSKGAALRPQEELVSLAYPAAKSPLSGWWLSVKALPWQKNGRATPALLELPLVGAPILPGLFALAGDSGSMEPLALPGWIGQKSPNIVFTAQIG